MTNMMMIHRRRLPSSSSSSSFLLLLLLLGILGSFDNNGFIMIADAAATVAIRWGGVDENTLLPFDGTSQHSGGNDNNDGNDGGGGPIAPIIDIHPANNTSNNNTNSTQFVIDVLFPTTSPGSDSSGGAGAGTAPTATTTDPASTRSTDEASSSSCMYQGEIIMSHPMSIGPNDKQYFLGYQMLRAAQISVDQLNAYPKCGVALEDGNYSVTLYTYGDESDGDKTAQIANGIVQDNVTDFILAGYSSSLTAHLTPITQDAEMICVTAGSSRKSVHAERDYVFGLNPPSTAYLEYAFKGTHDKGARTAAYVMEEGASACEGSAGMAEKYNMTLLAEVTIPEESELSVFEDVARNMSVLNPDLMITCVRTRITSWNDATRNIRWTPKAQVYTYIIGTKPLEEFLNPYDLPYIMGVSSWDRALPPIPDVVLGWTPGDFDVEFEKAAFDRPAYQHVQQSATISVLAQAMERVGNKHNHSAIRDVLATSYFSTVYGNVSFDENGQNAVPFLLLQYDPKGKLHVLLPSSQKFTDFDMVYPLPTWDARDCEFLSSCMVTMGGNGTCTIDGLCDCPKPQLSNGLYGSDAMCIDPIPKTLEERQNLIMVATIPAVTIVFVIAAIALYYIRLQARNDLTWQLKKSDLIFADPPNDIIGRGTFGEVLLAEYRGTKVAVKRVLPPGSNTSKKKKTAAAEHGGSVETLSSSPNDSDDAPAAPIKKQTFGMKSHSPHASLDDLLDLDTMSDDGNGGTGSGGGTKKNNSGGGFFGNSDASNHRTFRNNFMREMRYVSKLRHPCITTVMGAIVNSIDEPMLIMEYMEYGSLSDMLQNETMLLEIEILLPMIQDISQGCRFLHTADPQVIHGDLKAANILVDSKFRAKVADFGLTQKQKRGGVSGTPYFMAPELLRHETSNTAESDVYAFGIILYEVFSRKDPYEGEDAATVLREVADPTKNKHPPVPRDCPPTMGSLMTDCLVARAEERPTFEEIDKRLQRVDIKELSSFQTSTMNLRDRTTVSLFDIFPKHIAEALRDGKEVEPESRECVTIFFSDIVGFTDMSSTMDPRKVANMLDRLYSVFDALSHDYDIFKVETIGDAYMAVTNLVKDQPDDHAIRIAEFAVAAVQGANETLIDLEDPSKGYVNIRVGFHSGPVVADVVGSRNPRYCLFGDTVNTASRMESNSIKNRIHCSRDAKELLVKQKFSLPIKSRGLIEVKGKGEMHTYWINEGRDSVKRPSTMSALRTSVSVQPLGSVSFEPSAEFKQESALPPPSGGVSIPEGAEGGNWVRMDAAGMLCSG